MRYANPMKRQVFIAHAEGEQDLAEKLAGPLEKAGYEVIHQGTVLVGESIVEEAQKVLAAGGPVVVCATAKALGARWARKLANAVRKSASGHVFVMHMEEEADVELLAFGENVAAWWSDAGTATRQLVESLKRHYPLDAESAEGVVRYDAEKRYRQLALESCDIIDLANLPEGDRDIATRKLELRRLYVPLRVRVQLPVDGGLSEERLRGLEKQREEQRRGLPEPEAEARFPIGERLKRARRLVVLGDPGAGKSTLIRWLATAYLLRLKQDVDWKDLPDIKTLPEHDWLPIIVRCRDLDPSSLQGSLDDVLRHTLRKTEMSEAEAGALVRVLRDKLGRGEALLLIDGLDEISEPGVRIRFCEQLERIRAAFKDAPIVVTSRIVGYREMGGMRIGRDFEHVTVDDLASEDKDDFVRRWCEVTESPERRATVEQELLEDIHSTDRIERLTGNPMLLTTLALVKRTVGKLPRYRAELYGEAVKVLLNWRRAETEDPLELREVLPQLEFLAYAMCEQGVQRLRQDEVFTLLEQLRAEYPNLHTVRNHRPEQFLALLERQTGILVESGHEKHLGMFVPVYEFRHLTFQEYLAARALVKRCFPSAPARALAENIAPLVRKVVEYAIARDKGELDSAGSDLLSVASWDEVFRLCVTLCPDDDVDSVLRALLEPLPGEDAAVTTGLRTVLAAFCLVDEPNASAQVVRRILRGLVQVLEFREQQGMTVEFEGAVQVRESLFSLLRETRWAGEMARVLVHEFQRRKEPFIRNALLEFWRYFAVAGDRPSPGSFSSYVSRLSGTDDLEVIEAALTLSSWSWYSNESLLADASLQPIDGGALVALVERGGALSHAAALALSQLTGAAWGRRLWSPTPAQALRLVSVLASETADTGAVVPLMGILGSAETRAAVEPLIARLRRGSLELRRAAASALGAMKDSSAVDALIQALGDSDPEVRRSAVAALGMLGDARATGPLRGRLQDPDESVKCAVVEALARIPGAEALATLREAAADPNDNVRSQVVWRLRERKEPGDVELLILLLDDPRLSIRLEAVRALGWQKAPAAVEPLLAHLRRELVKLPSMELSLSRADLRPGFYMEDLWDERLVRAEAAFALGAIGDPGAVEPLLSLVEEVDVEIRPALLHALGLLGDGRSVKRLLSLLEASEPRVRLAAGESLARLGVEKGREFLLKKLSSERVEERTSALELLVGLYSEQEVDPRLLRIHEYRDAHFMDPRDVVDDARLQQIQEQTGIAPDEARRGLEAIAQRIPLRLSWRT